MARVLSEAEAGAALARQGAQWRVEAGELERVVRLRDFAEALAFVNAVGAAAEAADHHPDIDIRWNTVTLRLSTHSAGGITKADLDLAAVIDGLGIGDQT